MSTSSTLQMATLTPLRRLDSALQAAVVGQETVIADLLTAFLARGHVLLEGVPGVAKTLIARCMASALGLKFSRVQFTPDLMPSDILGTNVFRPSDNSFHLIRGPVFTELLVADEINRTPPKTQAALLDRFLMRIRVSYPDLDAERALVAAFHERKGQLPRVGRALSLEELDALYAT